MGNCLKTVSSHDDISLLRDSAPTAQRESSDNSFAILDPTARSVGIIGSQVNDFIIIIG